jgi:hypothetical protein
VVIMAGAGWPCRARARRGQAVACPLLLPGAAGVPGVKCGPQGRRAQQCRVVKRGRRVSTGMGHVRVTGWLVFGERGGAPVDQGIGNLWVPKISSTSRDQAIFVDQTTNLSVFSDAVPVEIDRLG